MIIKDLVEVIEELYLTEFYNCYYGINEDDDEKWCFDITQFRENVIRKLKKEYGLTDDQIFPALHIAENNVLRELEDTFNLELD